MGSPPISAKLVSTSLVLNQTGPIQTETWAAVGQLLASLPLPTSVVTTEIVEQNIFRLSSTLLFFEGIYCYTTVAPFDTVVLSFLSRDGVRK